MLKSIWALWAVGALLWCGAAVAQSDEENDARTQFDAGVSLFEGGQFAQASIAFARAYELRPSYKILYLVGKCENQQGHFAASLDAYTRYLADAAAHIDAARRAEVSAEIKRLGAFVGTVEIRASASGATVFVDDVRQGETPLPAPVFVDLGQHTVVLKKGTREMHREIVKVAGGQRVVVEVSADSDSGTSPGVSPDGSIDAPPASVVDVLPDAPVPQEGSDGAQGPQGRRRWTWIAAGVAGAAAIGGGIAGGVALHRESELRADCDGTQCDSSSQADADDVRTASIGADVMFGIAGAAAVAAIVLFFVEPDDERSVDMQVTLSPSTSGAVFGARGRF